MSACAEAKASFRHICLEVGLTEEQFDFLKDQNITTLNVLAFSVCGQPGQIDDARFRMCWTVLSTMFPFELNR
jgi:hypothetical protein